MAINPLPLAGVGLAAVAVAGGLYATGTGTSQEGIGGGNNKIQKIEWRSLYEDKEFWNTSNSGEISDTYKEKWGKKYARYMLGAGTHKQGATEKLDNAAWWTKRLEELNKGKPDTGKFKDVNSASAGSDNTKVLSKVCDAAYKEQTTNVTSGNQDQNKYKEEEVWKFCSPLGKKPTTISSNTTTDNYTSGIGSESEYKSKLISVNDSENDLFWRIKQEEFFAGNPPTDGTEAYFKKFHEDNIANKEDLILKKKCGELYSQAANTSQSSTTQPKKDEVAKYCSLDN